MGGSGGNSQAYHVVKTVVGLLIAASLVVLGLRDLQGQGWVLLLIAAAIVMATVLRWVVFREKP